METVQGGMLDPVSTISFNSDGLVEFDHDGCTVRARVGFDSATARMRPVEVHILNAAGITNEMLRTLPMRRIEAFINLRYGRPEEPPPPIRLRVPKGSGRRPDDFYRQVGAAYEYLAEQMKAPAAEIARKNRVPITTAHRWVREARARGFLPPGRKGSST